MAESSKKPEFTGLWPILALFLIATGYIQLNPRLDSPRPVGETAPLDVDRPGEGVRAALAGPVLGGRGRRPSPFEGRPAEDSPVLHAAGAKDVPPAPISKRAQDDRDSLKIQKTLGPLLKDHKRLREKPGIPLLILPTFLGGDPYPEDVETPSGCVRPCSLPSEQNSSPPPMRIV